MNLRRLELTLTTKCNSQCIHCQADASPTRNDVMIVKDAYEYLNEATAISTLKSFMLFGGEPMLFPEKAIAIFEKAHRLKIPRIDMITNGSWGKNQEKAEKLAEKLKTAGLTKVDVSVDAFHLQHIPLEYPKNAASALLKARVNEVKWNVAVVKSIDAENEYDTKTRQMLKELGPIGIGVSFVKIIPVGRATQSLRKFFAHEPLYGPCEGDPILGNPLTNPESICIEPSGSVNICWRLSIGNAQEKPLSQIIKEYEWQKSPIIKTLVEKGPLGLLELSEGHGFKLQERLYINKCHLCTEIRKTLKFS